MTSQLTGVTKYCNVCIPCNTTTQETTVVVGTDVNVGDTLNYQYILSNGGYCNIRYTDGNLEKEVFAEPAASTSRIVAGGSFTVNDTHKTFVFSAGVTVYRRAFVDTYDVCCQAKSMDELVDTLIAYGFAEYEIQAAINQYLDVTRIQEPIPVTQEQYEELVASGEIDNNRIYIIVETEL